MSSVAVLSFLWAVQAEGEVWPERAISPGRSPLPDVMPRLCVLEGPATGDLTWQRCPGALKTSFSTFCLYLGQHDTCAGAG